MRIRKCKLALTGLQWSIIHKAKSICENSLIFKNPFPLISESVIVRFDAWGSASRQFNMKGEILQIREKVDGYVSKPPHASRYILIWFSSKKIRNNLKSHSVRKVEEGIREQHGLADSRIESEPRIDFLLPNNQYFCKYQDIYPLSLKSQKS